MTLGTGVYGTNASNAVSYSVAAVAAGDLIASAKFTDIAAKVNSERTRRGGAATTLNVTNPISSAQYNAIRSALSIAGPAETQAYNTNATVTITTYPQVAAPALPAAVAGGGTITAAQINGLISSLYNAGIQCTCNCNYCTCNCNYCTCNCNYACTCNCNY